jgi:hypothetical protein
MIVRLLGEGQLSVAEGAFLQFNVLDNDVMAAIDANDEEAFGIAYAALLAKVRELGAPVEDDTAQRADTVMPGAWASIGDVRDMLTSDGIFPG